ncbi:hypothetical protein QFC19_005373 [Naganishia cerealis]|uniref:Uncharacterized protein n=1 Tax=Naganishia cerealis TaxID=610337 RepID=A0ACC2VPZ9_9TREE|nr:hypothetical protein QFC19_005373 [Naganishia cerealis]
MGQVISAGLRSLIRFRNTGPAYRPIALQEFDRIHQETGFPNLNTAPSTGLLLLQSFATYILTFDTRDVLYAGPFHCSIMSLRFSTTVSAICRQAPTPVACRHAFSTSAPACKKFKPQPLFLLPGQKAARKSKIPKKLLERRSQRDGLKVVPAERAAGEIFEELDEDNLVGLWKRTNFNDGEEGFQVSESAPEYDRNTKSRRVPLEEEDRFNDSRRVTSSFGIGRRSQLLRSTIPSQQSPSISETSMAQRLRETKESLIDLDSPAPSPPPLAPKVEVHPETVIPAWKIPTEKEYEQYSARKVRGARNNRRGPDERVGWSDQANITPEPRRPRDTRSQKQPLDRVKAFDLRDTSRTPEPEPVSSHNPPSEPKLASERSPDRWEPTKKLSIPAMQGLRELYRSDPQTFNQAVLSEKFGISREAVGRIIHSKFRDQQPS